MLATAPLEQTVNALFAEMRRVICQQLGEQGLAISPPQIQILATIGEQPGISAGEVARLTNRDKATITRMLAPLLKSSWVERSCDPADARRQCLTLTRSGQKARLASRAALSNAHAQIFGALDQDEAAQLTQLLAKCLQQSDNANGITEST